MDKLLLIEFFDNNIDSTYLLKGIDTEQLTDSTYNINSTSTQILADSNVISLKELDELEDNTPNGIILKPPKKYRYPPTINNKNANTDKLHKLYRDFDRAVYEGKIKLRLIDTSKHYTSNERFY